MPNVREEQTFASQVRFAFGQEGSDASPTSKRKSARPGVVVKPVLPLNSSCVVPLKTRQEQTIESSSSNLVTVDLDALHSNRRKQQGPAPFEGTAMRRGLIRFQMDLHHISNSTKMLTGQHWGPCVLVESLDEVSSSDSFPYARCDCCKHDLQHRVRKRAN